MPEQYPNKRATDHARSLLPLPCPVLSPCIHTYTLMHYTTTQGQETIRQYRPFPAGAVARWWGIRFERNLLLVGADLTTQRGRYTATSRNRNTHYTYGTNDLNSSGYINQSIPRMLGDVGLELERDGTLSRRGRSLEEGTLDPSCMPVPDLTICVEGMPPPCGIQR